MGRAPHPVVGCYVPAYFLIYILLCGGAGGCLMGRQTLGRQNARIPAPHGDVMTNDMEFMIILCCAYGLFK
jgi:hypothetical protein